MADFYELQTQLLPLIKLQKLESVKQTGSIISRTDRKSFYRSLLSMKKQNIQKLR
ncbi:hypothetical protein ACJK25_02705 [Enterococcus faecium]